MKKFFTANDHVLPRPPEKLSEYANAKARRNLAEKLVAVFGMSDQAADTIANAVVDPSAVRKSIGEPDDPQVEEIAVPGGVLLGVRTTVWSRWIMPDPRNPRIGPSRRHPFAVDPGTGDEDSRFRPVPEPRSPDDALDTAPEFLVEIDSRQHLEWASAQAAKYVLAENDWRESIKCQGVMEAVWVVPTTYTHADGASPATALVTVEGSSRTAAVHNILEVRSADVPYEDPDRKLRAHYKGLIDAFEQRTLTSDQTVALRCERMPALVLVGFRRNGTSAAGFPTAVKSLVALRHVDPPRPWGEGPANEALADEVLDELFRQKLITATERAYYAGSCTKSQAMAAHLSPEPACRAARVVALFAQADDGTGEAIRLAVTSQSTRKRISKKMCNELATALIVRSVATETSKTDRVRRYMRDAFFQGVYNEAAWQCTGRDTDTLVKAAIDEVRRALGNDEVVEPGPAALELAVRAAYPLIVAGALHSDRGTRDTNQPDRRVAGEVLDAMRRTPRGVQQLGQALRDFSAEQPIRAVEEDGTVRQRPDGTGAVLINDAFLRNEFPPPGKTPARTGGLTPTEQLRNRLADLSEAMDRLEESHKAVAAVAGNDGVSLVEVEGVDPQFCTTRRQLLSRIGDDLSYWSRTYRKRYGAPAVPDSRDDSEESDGGADAACEEAEDPDYESDELVDRARMSGS